MNMEELLSLPKDEIELAIKNISSNQISNLIGMLSSKEDEIRYQAFLLLKARSTIANDVYPYWDLLTSKLTSDNSYQRSIALMLLSENVQWDQTIKMNDTIEAYLGCLHDEKPVTIRQCIQSFPKIMKAHPHLLERMTQAMLQINLDDIRETMRKSILLDIVNVLLQVQEIRPSRPVQEYLSRAIDSGLLDLKTKKQIRESRN